MKRWKGRIGFKGWFWERLARIAARLKRLVARFVKRHRKLCTVALIAGAVVLAGCGLWGTIELVKNLATAGEIAEGVNKLVGGVADAEGKIEETEAAAGVGTGELAVR